VFGALTTVSGLASWWAPATGSGTGELRFDFGTGAPLVIRVLDATPGKPITGAPQRPPVIGLSALSLERP
jgi:hypothetical protein